MEMIPMEMIPLSDPRSTVISGPSGPKPGY